mmetsp:Transcript_6726/g.11127  ORF Transcript_6726/g.11127 Transcript_6726/m.11127 type:complete len:229 (-) Transcript_6726:1821-2507(-)
MGKGNCLLDTHLSTSLEHGGLLGPNLFTLDWNNRLVQFTQSNRNAKWIDIGHADMTHLKGGRNVGAMKGGSQGHGFIRINVQSQLHRFAQVGLNVFLNLGHTHATSNQFNTIDFFQSHIGTLKSVSNGLGGASEQIAAQVFQNGTCNLGLERCIRMKTFNVNRKFRIGRQNMLDLVGLNAQFRHWSRKLTNVTTSTPFLVKGVCQIFDNAMIQRRTAQSSIPRLAHDF